MGDPMRPASESTMVRDTRPMTITYKGQSATFDMPGWYGDRSEESLHTREDTKVSDRALSALKAKVERLMDADEVRRVRRKLRLSQREAGRIVGGGPNAFQKYESGEILPSRAISNFLRVLERHPEEVSRLREELGLQGSSDWG